MITLKDKKNTVLQAIQERVPLSLSYKIVKKIYEITKSYDAIIDLSEIALRYNKDIIELAIFLY